MNEVWLVWYHGPYPDSKHAVEHVCEDLETACSMVPDEANFQGPPSEDGMRLFHKRVRRGVSTEYKVVKYVVERREVI